MKTLRAATMVTTLTPNSRHLVQIELDSVMSFEFDPLVHRMVDKYQWAEDEARSVFEDTKRYLYLARMTGKPLIPPAKVDEMWHNFILFTADYASFCERRLGKFIHHRPRRRDDCPYGSGVTVRDTLDLAQSVFGTLSTNWDFPGAKAQSGCSCSDWCKCS
jgi:hypothetical protein